MPRKKKPAWEDISFSGEASPGKKPRRRLKRRRAAPPQRLWTRDKAELIKRYIYGFLMVTRHGTYVDGFAGALRADEPQTWAANLVLELEPKWLRHFHLFELEDEKIPALENLRAGHQGAPPGRTVDVYHEDFNQGVGRILLPEIVPVKEATFCLVDQQTVECQWGTLERLAAYQREADFKMELFYFLPNSWLDRTLKTRKAPGSLQELQAWWGRDDWPRLKAMHGQDRADWVAERFHNELDYGFARPYAIYDPEHRTRVMYYMIHATDHPRAPKLMDDAHRTIVTPGDEGWEQLRLG